MLFSLSIILILLLYEFYELSIFILKEVLLFNHDFFVFEELLLLVVFAIVIGLGIREVQILFQIFLDIYVGVLAVSFQDFLQIGENGFRCEIHVFVRVESFHMAPFQDLAAFHNSLKAFFEEL